MHHLLGVLIAIGILATLEGITVSFQPFDGVNAISIERRARVNASMLVSGVQSYQNATGADPANLSDIAGYTGRTDGKAVGPIRSMAWSVGTTSGQVYGCLSGAPNSTTLDGLQRYEDETDLNVVFETGCGSGSSTTPSAGSSVYMTVYVPS